MRPLRFILFCATSTLEFDICWCTAVANSRSWRNAIFLRACDFFVGFQNYSLFSIRSPLGVTGIRPGEIAFWRIWLGESWIFATTITAEFLPTNIWSHWANISDGHIRCSFHEERATGKILHFLSCNNNDWIWH